MTELLEKAFAEASKLPEDRQEALAALILEEIADEELWGKSFESSQDVLEKMADEALRDFREGRTTKPAW